LRDFPHQNKNLISDARKLTSCMKALKPFHFILPAFTAFLLLCGCKEDTTSSFNTVTSPQVEIDLPHILERDTLIALVSYNSNSFYIYRGATKGFEYDLLVELAKHLGVELKVQVARDLDTIFDRLNMGDGDLVAHNLAGSRERRQLVNFTDYYTNAPQVLVQRLPKNWRRMKLHEIERQMLKYPIELMGKKIHVRRGSAYYARLLSLTDEIGIDIDIVEVPGNISTDELIARVSSGEIDYTVADQNIALINQAYYSNIHIKMPVSLPQPGAWAVRKNSPELLAAINEWLKGLRQTPTFNVLFNKYFRNKRYFRQRASSDFFSLTGGKISRYDDLIQQYAEGLNWDWRLLAAQIYRESQFDPKAESWMGASGLMQLVPETAERFGVKDTSDPEQSIAAGVKYLKWLYKFWDEIPDSSEQLKFVLASYNAGQGHVRDAQRLTKKYGKDPLIWEDNVAFYLLKKTQEEYYTDEVVNFGYVRGGEPVNYVSEVLQLYENYKQLVPADSLENLSVIPPEL